MPEVVWPSRQSEVVRISSALDNFSKTVRPLLGIRHSQARGALALQMVASLRRLDYTKAMMARGVDPRRADPNDELFDPERAAILHSRSGNVDEAIWLIFLATHFGKHGRHGWRRLRDVYSGLGGCIWTWSRVSSAPDEFESWIATHYHSIGGAFGNHRKYESLRPDSGKRTTVVVRSFIECLCGNPTVWFASLTKRGGNDPHSIFDLAYKELRVARFGRLAKFDFLALLGRMNLAPISPGAAYLKGATGPLRGARLLVDGDVNSSASADDLQIVLSALDKSLKVGMQVMEDSICNWQKSPSRFKHFRG